MVRSHNRTLNSPNRAGQLGWLGAPKPEALKFFYEHAGYSHKAGATKAEQKKARLENAKALARAEEYAREKGWRVDWEEDPEADLSFLGEDDNPADHEVLVAVLRDKRGEVLGALGGIDFLRQDVKGSRDYGRVVEAELAYEAMP